MPKISEKDTIVVFGGTGFIGTYLIKELASTKAKIIVICSDANSRHDVKLSGFVGQIALTQINIKDPKAIDAIIKGAGYVINLIGIMFESRAFKFRDLHVDLPKNIGKSCAKHKIKTLIHVSALGIEKALSSRYALSKLHGEQELRQEFAAAVILKPSVVFGPEDRFINLFNRIMRFSPVVPLIGGGTTKFQPVYVQDLAKSIGSLLKADGASVAGATFEIAGPKVYTLREINSYIMKVTGRKRWFFSVPFYIAKLEALFLQLSGIKLLTVDQVELLKYNNIASKKEGLAGMVAAPTPMEAILPQYLK